MFPNLHDAADMLKRLPALLRPTTPTEPPMSTPPITAPTSPLRWAIVELFGHATIAGAISEEAFGGGTFTRIDVPEVSWPDEVYVQGKPEVTMRVIAAHSKLFGANALYSITPVDEAAAVAMAHRVRHQPIKRHQLLDALRALSAQDRRSLLLAAEQEEETRV